MHFVFHGTLVRMRLCVATLALFLRASPLLPAANSYTYIGQIEAHSVLVAWGTTEGANTIGRSSPSTGQNTVTVGTHHITTEKNWAVVNDLEPDQSYHYEVVSGNRKIGQGTVRTYPEHATRLCFFVIGDYGTGTAGQYQISRVMEQEYRKRTAAGEPVRFVLTTGDNIYADLNLGFRAIHSGSEDRDWEDKFFRAYQSVIREIPFYPSPGNHDGNGTENQSDLSAYLDNFFYPGNQPARWYTFQFADLAQFFSLDSTTNTPQGRPQPAFAENGEQFQWFQKAVEASHAIWKIPYWHHPVYNAGPFHGASYGDLKHFVRVFEKQGVKVVFSGHEHNFQFSEDSAATGSIRYVVSGAGGELRHGNIQSHMEKAHMEGWAAERHFLVVEIEGKEMRITPMGTHPFLPVNSQGKPIAMPLTIKVP